MGMTNVWMVLVGVVATVAICYQNVSSALAYGWALVHGAGPAALLAFLPLAAGLALLWAGYLFLRRKTVRGRPLIFAAYACTIVGLNQMRLPDTPHDLSAVQETVRGVRIDKIRDEVVLSAAGNPIGVRLTFEAVVPETGSYAITASWLQPDQENHPNALQLGWHRQYAFQFGRVFRETIAPEPIDREFLEGAVYTFSRVLLPHFLRYDDRTAQPCFHASVLGDLREEVFVETVSRAATTRLRTGIQVGREEGTQSVIAAEYVTQRDYDLGAFYRTIVTEGNKRCGS